MDLFYSIMSSSSRMRILAVLVLTGIFFWFVSSFAGGLWEGGQTPSLYGGRDVAIISLLFALPLAGTLAVCINRRHSAAGSIGLAAFSFGVGIVPLLAAVRADILSVLISCPPLGIVFRAATALGLALSAALTLAALQRNREARGRRAEGRRTACLVGLGVIVLLLPPWTYVRARCRHDIARLGEFVEQSRFGEAALLVRGLLPLDARREWNGRPLTQVAQELERIVRELESRVAVPLAVSAPSGQRLDRARQLAMLGRTEAALAVLRTIREANVAAEVEDLRGAIGETTEKWQTALGAYRRARTAWETRPSSAVQAAGLVRATTGIAYCQRKMGRYTEAEAAYQQVLALAPTADSHFLLAQFYEDIQQAEKARSHARRAMVLAPARYERKGQALIHKLAVFHFGCLNVFNAEKDQFKASLVAKKDIENP